MLQNEMKWTLERDKTPSYLEPWQREPVDPAVEHVVTLEKKGEIAYEGMRASCSCGFDQGWQSATAASQAADWHCQLVRDTKIAHGLDSLPTPLIERKQSEIGPQFRWTCNCVDRGPWLTSEVIAALGSTLHTQACEERRRLRDARPTRRRTRRP